MTSLPPESLLSSAEFAYADGRLSEAHNHLLTLERAGPGGAKVHHLRALVEQALGRPEQAWRAFNAAAELAPDDPHVANDMGKLLAQLGDEQAALAAYERALTLASDFQDAALNRAISLYRLQRYAEARRSVEALLSQDPLNIVLWTLRGYLERDIGDLAAAATAFNRALEIQQDNPVALNGRARMALEREEGDVLDRYGAARAASPGDPQLFLEQTEARIARGDAGAIDEFARTAAQLPQWTDGQVALGRMLWESRADPGFAGHIEDLLRREPRRLDLWNAFIELLAGCNRYEAAADAARNARKIGGGGAESRSSRRCMRGVPATSAGPMGYSHPCRRILPGVRSTRASTTFA